MLIGTPAISFVGGVGGAHLHAARRAVAGTADATAVRADADFRHPAISAALSSSEAYAPSLLILAAISLASVALAPVAAGAALRFQLQ
jgi:heme exporter protein B